MMQFDEYRGSAPASSRHGSYRHAGFYAELKAAPRPAPRKSRPALRTWSASTAEGVSPIAVIFNGFGFDNASMQKRELKRNNLRSNRSLGRDYTVAGQQTTLQQGKMPPVPGSAPMLSSKGKGSAVVAMLGAAGKDLFGFMMTSPSPGLSERPTWGRGSWMDEFSGVVLKL